MFPEGAIPIVPVQAGPRSERISPNKFDAMMLDYLGENEASNSIVQAIEKSLSSKDNRTKDLGGDADTIKSSNSILSNL